MRHRAAGTTWEWQRSCATRGKSARCLAQTRPWRERGAAPPSPCQHSCRQTAHSHSRLLFPRSLAPSLRASPARARVRSRLNVSVHVVGVVYVASKYGRRKESSHARESERMQKWKEREVKATRTHARTSLGTSRRFITGARSETPAVFISSASHFSRSALRFSPCLIFAFRWICRSR